MSRTLLSDAANGGRFYAARLSHSRAQWTHSSVVPHSIFNAVLQHLKAEMMSIPVQTLVFFSQNK